MNAPIERRCRIRSGKKKGRFTKCRKGRKGRR
jgi:hypothetical protein